MSPFNSFHYSDVGTRTLDKTQVFGRKLKTEYIEFVVSEVVPMFCDVVMKILRKDWGARKENDQGRRGRRDLRTVKCLIRSIRGRSPGSVKKGDDP